MSTTTETDVDRTGTTRTWIYAAVGGFLGTVVLGGLQHAAGKADAMRFVYPAMYGVQGPALEIGWAIHLFHGVVLGLIYGAAVSLTPLRSREDGLVVGTVFGTVYGAILWVVPAGLLMPLWLRAVGFPSPPPFPSFDVPSLVGHVVYGLVLGLLFAALHRFR